MQARSPTPTITDAEHLAHEHWGLDGQATSLVGYEDHNFLLASGAGDRWVLKISREGVDERALDCQIQVLKFLEESAVALLVQRVRPAADGRCLIPIETGDGGLRWVRVFSYLEGTPLAKRRRRPRPFLEEIGRTLARLDLALSAFDHPGAHRHVPWNIERAHEIGR